MKTAMDFLMFKEGIDGEKFGSVVRDKVMYRSSISSENGAITISLKGGDWSEG